MNNLNTFRETERGKFYIYTSDAAKNGRLDELISVQLYKGGNQFSAPVFHILPVNKGWMYCQFLANMTNNKVRMTKPKSILDDVTALNGKYFSPHATV